uniref:Uncharacterized protein n=1 Tax=Arundo donax TaxID=35708 RepID=A0A0A9B6V5_ARUDO
MTITLYNPTLPLKMGDRYLPSPSCYMLTRTLLNLNLWLDNPPLVLQNLHDSPLQHHHLTSL